MEDSRHIKERKMRHEYERLAQGLTTVEAVVKLQRKFEEEEEEKGHGVGRGQKTPSLPLHKEQKDSNDIESIEEGDERYGNSEDDDNDNDNDEQDHTLTSPNNTIDEYESLSQGDMYSYKKNQPSHRSTSRHMKGKRRRGKGGVDSDANDDRDDFHSFGIGSDWKRCVRYSTFTTPCIYLCIYLCIYYMCLFAFMSVIIILLSPSILSSSILIYNSTTIFISMHVYIHIYLCI